MAFAGHQHDYAAGANEYSTDDKFVAQHISDTSIANHAVPNRRQEAPPLVRIMSDDERFVREAVLVRKIDLRLMPMIILMYIMNYLDRNNIAAARLAGLQKELKLTSTQYSVGAASRKLVGSVADDIHPRLVSASSLSAMSSCKVYQHDLGESSIVGLTGLQFHPISSSTRSVDLLFIYPPL